MSFEPLDFLSLAVVFSCRVVKEEISDDNAKLPCFNGRVVSWVRQPVSVCLLSAVGTAAGRGDGDKGFSSLC